MPEPHGDNDFLHSLPFDHKSIMILDSVFNKARQTIYTPLQTSGGEFIFMGGNQQVREAGLSALDIERVADLYPLQNIDPSLLQSGPHVKRSNDTGKLHGTQPTLMVVVPGGVTTTVRPVPTDPPMFVNDSKAVEIVEKYAADCQGHCSGDVVIQ